MGDPTPIAGVGMPSSFHSTTEVEGNYSSGTAAGKIGATTLNFGNGTTSAGNNNLENTPTPSVASSTLGAPTASSVAGTEPGSAVKPKKKKLLHKYHSAS